MSGGSYAKLLEQKKVFTEERGSTLTGLVWNTIMAQKGYIFFRLQVYYYERVAISLVEVYKRVGKSVIGSVKGPKRANR